MAKVELKQPIVAAIAEDIKDAQSVVIVDYRGLTVAQDTELRKKLREAGVTYKVCKNTMMKRAFEGTEFAVQTERLRLNYDTDSTDRDNYGNNKKDVHRGKLLAFFGYGESDAKSRGKRGVRAWKTNSGTASG